MARLQAVLLDFANTVAQFDRPQIEAIHVALAEHLSRTVAPIDARALGAVMDRVCVAQPLSEDRRELTPDEQMRRIVREAYGQPFAADDRVVTDADRVYQEAFMASLSIDAATLRRSLASARACRSGSCRTTPAARRCGDRCRHWGSWACIRS